MRCLLDWHEQPPAAHVAQTVLSAGAADVAVITDAQYKQVNKPLPNCFLKSFTIRTQTASRRAAYCILRAAFYRC